MYVCMFVSMFECESMCERLSHCMNEVMFWTRKSLCVSVRQCESVRMDELWVCESMCELHVHMCEHACDSVWMYVSYEDVW